MGESNLCGAAYMDFDYNNCNCRSIYEKGIFTVFLIFFIPKKLFNLIKGI